jgi:hypothetical protein
MPELRIANKEQKMLFFLAFLALSRVFFSKCAQTILF